MTRVLHARGDVTAMFLFFLGLFLGGWQLLVAWRRLSGLSLTGNPDRKCFSLVLGAVLVAGSCSWYFSTPGHFASPDVEGMETLLLLAAGLVTATLAQATLASAAGLLRTTGRRRQALVDWGEKTEIDVGGKSVPGRFTAGSGRAGGIPVLLLHDYGGSSSDLGDLASAIAAGGRPALAVDLDGHGANPRGISDASMSDLLEAASEELRRRSGGGDLDAAGIGLGAALAMELHRAGRTRRVFAVDPPPRDREGAALVNALRELGPVEVVRSFLKPPARREGGGRLSLARLIKELPEPGLMEPGEVAVAGTEGEWFVSQEVLEEWVKGIGLPGVILAAATHRSAVRDAALLEALTSALS